MISKLRPYPEMKDTEIETLGAVPEHWKTLPLKRIGAFNGGTGFPISAQGNPNGEILFAKVSDMNRIGNEQVICRCANTISRATAQNLGATIFEDGTIIFPKVGAALFTNKRRMIIHPTCIDNNLMAFKPQGVDTKYMFRILECVDLARIANPGPVPSINGSQVREIRVALPPHSEQTYIVKFLDHINRNIRQFIRKRKRIIALLGEQKQAMIDQVMTGQIDVRNGKPYPKYKPAEYKWLGDVPMHWKTRRLKSYASNIVNLVGDRELNQIYIALEHVESWTGRIVHEDYSTIFESRVKSFEARDVLFGKLRPYLAKVTFPGRPGVCVGEFLVLRSHDNRLIPRYLDLLLRSKFVIDVISASAFGAKMPRTDWRLIGNMNFSFPPCPEQSAIVSFLDRIDQHTQRYIRAKEREITLLREFRTRLISDVVTGKLDVREAETQLLKRAGDPELMDVPSAQIDNSEGWDEDSEIAGEEIGR